MDFSFTPEHEMTKKMVRNFAQKEIVPVIKEYDRKQEPIPLGSAHGRTRHSGSALSCPLWWCGHGLHSWGLACEELEAVDTSLRVVMSVHTGLCAMTVFQWGTEEQKQKFLVPLAKGEKIGCGAFTESGMGSDVAAMSTSAKRDGDYYILNGEKMWISLASKADLALVTVKTNNRPKNHPKACLPSLLTCIATGSRQAICMANLACGQVRQAGLLFKMSKCRGKSNRRRGRRIQDHDDRLRPRTHTVASGATGIIRACLEASVNMPGRARPSASPSQNTN